MRYKVGEFEIRTENTAKPIKQAAKPLVKWIETLPRQENILDYGCGKLRYAVFLAKKCEHLTVVDSPEQIYRIQVIDNTQTTVKDYVTSMLPGSRVLTIDEFQIDKEKYDFILCANIIPSIPLREFQDTAFASILRAMKPNGGCLFVTQYRNSYFDEIIKSGRTIKHLDGWILKAKSGPSYYGIINRPKLETMVKEHGFDVSKSWNDGQSAYVLACQSISPQ